MQEPPTLAAPICSLRNFSSGVISTSLAFSICRAHTGKSHPQLPGHTVRLAPCPTPLLLPCGLCWAKNHPPKAPRASSSSRTPDWAPAGILSGVPQPCSSPQRTLRCFQKLPAPSLCPSSAVGEGRGLEPPCPQHHLGHGATGITPLTGAEPPRSSSATTPRGAAPLLGPYHAHPLVLQVPQHRGKLLQGLGCKGHTKRFST